MSEGKLQRRRARGFVGATATHLYIAIQTQLPDEGALVAVVKRDSLKVVDDDAAEVYVCPTPDAVNRVDYQFLCNSLGKSGYNIHLLGAVREEPSWQGGYEQAHTQQDGWWNTDIAIPLARLGAGAQGRKATDGSLGRQHLPRLEAGLELEQPQRRLRGLRPPVRVHGRACPRRTL